MASSPRYVTTGTIRHAHFRGPMLARSIHLIDNALLPCEVLHTDEHRALLFELTDAERPEAIILLGRICRHDVELCFLVANGDSDEAVGV
jgi:hypothetical protein